jgi:hypothetical protein
MAISITDKSGLPKLQHLSEDDLKTYIDFNIYVKTLQDYLKTPHTVKELDAKLAELKNEIEEFDELTTTLEKPNTKLEAAAAVILPKGEAVRSRLTKLNNLLQKLQKDKITDDSAKHDLTMATVLKQYIELTGEIPDGATAELDRVITSLSPIGAVQSSFKDSKINPSLGSLMGRATPIIEKIRAKYAGKDIPSEINNKLTLLELFVLTNSNKENKEVAEKDKNKLKELVEYFEKMNTEVASAPVTASKGALDRSASSRLGFGPQKRAGPPNPILQSNPIGKGRLIIGKTGP